MELPPIYDVIKRYRTLRTHRISNLPIAILMPHSACNCRCVMCDIWKGNQRLKQLTEEDIAQILEALQNLGTRQVLMSGGEALLNPSFFRFCELLKEKRLRITVLSTGLTLAKHAASLVKWTDEVIVSLDGHEALHDQIRNVPAAFRKMKEGIVAIRAIDAHFPVQGRTVIHRLNYQHWPAIVDAAKEIGLNSISFLPADVSSTAFSRDQPWDLPRQNELLLPAAELPAMQRVIDRLAEHYAKDIQSGFIVEPLAKLQKIHQYYVAQHGLDDFPLKKCNAPWVSAVVEADGTVKPCFFQEAYGNIHQHSLQHILNDEKAMAFRKQLDMARNDTCRKCVCYLHLKPTQRVNPS